MGSAQRGFGHRARQAVALLSLLAAVAVLGAVFEAASFVAGGPSSSPPSVASSGTRGAAGSGAVTRFATQQVERVSKASDWRLNVGHAVDVLRKDIPRLFGQAHHTPDFSIYSEAIEVVDARLPSFQVRGLSTYQRLLSMLQWSVSSTCEYSRMEITAVTLPVNNVVYMRWKLHLVGKDMLAPAKGFLASFDLKSSLFYTRGSQEPFIVEGYSNYDFDPWTGEIVKHTIDITNPPMYITDILKQYATPQWLTPSMTPGMQMPRMWQEAPAPQVPQPLGFLPQGCEDDFECNDGKANFPLQCCELPILGKFCCEPDDYEPIRQAPAYVPIPVPVEDDRWP